MKRYSILLLAVMLTASSSFAQNDANAKKVLDAVSAKVKASKGMTAGITLKSVSNKGNDKGSQSGSLSMKGNKYQLKKGKTEIICDGSKVYNYDAENKTITVSSAEESNSALNPQRLLSGSYEKDFGYKLISSSGSSYQIEITPNDPRKNFQKVELFVDKAKSLITKVMIYDKSNNITELTVNNMNTNATLPDNLFIFNKGRYPPDVEILD